MLRVRDRREGLGQTVRRFSGAALVACSSLLVLLAACDGAGDEAGLIVHRTFAEEGANGPFASALVVRNGDGEELRRIEVPEPAGIFPTEHSATALVATFDQRTYLVDAAEGTSKELEVPRGTFPGPPPSFVGGGRFTIMSTPNRDAAYLIDLENADVLDLSEIVGEIEFVETGVFSPEGDHLLLSSGSGLWLIPPDSPDDARKVTDELVRVTPYAFSEDGSRFVYAAVSEEGGSAVVARVDGTESENVGSDVIDASFGRSNEDLLLSTRDGLELVRGDEPIELTSETTGILAVSPAGNALVGNNVTGFELVNPDERSAQSIDELSESEPIFLGRDQRWLLFRDEDERTFRGLDLDTGDVSSVLTLPEAMQMTPPFDATPDGSLFLLSILPGAGETRVWLLDLEGGESQELPGEGFVTGSLSEDGKWVAFGDLPGLPEGEPRGEISLLPTDGGDPEAIGEGANPVWLAP
jgi:hypothetical protein